MFSARAPRGGSDAAESRGEESRGGGGFRRLAGERGGREGERERERRAERESNATKTEWKTELERSVEWDPRASEQASIFAGLDAATEGDAPLLANTLRNREPVASGRAHTRASARAPLYFLMDDARPLPPPPRASKVSSRNSSRRISILVAIVLVEFW